MSDCASEPDIYGRCSPATNPRGQDPPVPGHCSLPATRTPWQPHRGANRAASGRGWGCSSRGPSGRLTTATGRETERVAPPRAHQARVGECQPVEEPVTRTVQETAKVTADHARQRKLARGCEHRNRECLHVGDAEPLREVRRPERLLVRDDHLGPLRLRHPPAVLEHAADHGEHLPAKRGLLAVGCRQERPKVRPNRCKTHSPARCELLERGVRRQHTS